ncbi:MAG TPA: Calx-beta domain-containing protein [Thermoanaerobaculia bacterium]|jgi:disulfide oxidoreductase YuzD|nr:Calx-beta domain-containing protein [Thermoanaerobaculia bacterium]
MLLATSASAATFTVINTLDSGAGSLRQAIIDANTAAGVDTISFAIPGSGLHTISPATNLPNITGGVIIDGYSQSGSSVNTLSLGDNAVLQIELNGASVSGGTGLNFTAAVNAGEVKGLLITKWNNAILFNGATNITVDGNFFGTNAAGSATSFATANGSAFFILNTATGNTVGGAAAAARNLISGGTTAGITLGNSGTANNIIQNNYIGTNAAGTAALPNFVGISFNGAGANTIRGNVISGNTSSSAFSAGIQLENTTSNILVVGNKIGTSADGLTAIPNMYGITLLDGFSGGANQNTIGTLAEPNVIAFNTKAGVALQAFTSKVSRQNTIRYNSIFSNGTLGIDLGDDGITPNDVGDGDAGSFNDLQNFPVITSAQFGGGTVTIAGTLSSAPSSTYVVQFFQSIACDPSGAGEGQTYLGEATITTAASGVGTFNVTFAGTAGGFATSTATDSLGNTSEFSACAAISTPVTPSISISDAQVVEGNAGTATMTFNVFLSAASASTVTASFATASGTATSGTDFTPNSGTVTFTAGQTMQTINVSVLGDVTPEADETLLVNLTNPVNATIADNQGVGTIKNDDALSALSISDITLAEGNSGTTSFDFTVTLSPVSAFPVTINYATADNTAIVGSDYQPTSGALTFAPGQTTKTVSVLVNGDVTTEPNETFFVNLFNPGNASVSDAQGLGTITNDDANPSITINDPSVVEGNASSTNMSFVITLSNPTSITLSVPFSLADGTATVGSDYQTNSGSFTVFPGATTAQVSIGINGDTTVEPDETFFVNLGATSGATIADNQGVGTIINDDGLASPGISINNVIVAEGNSGTVNASFTVSLTAGSASTITVNYATADNTATVANSDYVAKSGLLTFTPGQTSQNVVIVVNGDTTFEPNETFFVNLTAPTNGIIIKAQGTGTITNDDVVGSADLSITKNGAATAAGNTNVTYTITVINNSASGATNVVVTDPPAGGSTFVSASSTQGSCASGSPITCSLGSLAGGASATITLTMKMPNSTTTVSNIASVTASESDPNTNNNSATAVTAVTVGGPAPIPALSTLMLLALAALLSAWAVTRLR